MENDVKCIISGDIKTASTAFRNFLEKIDKSFTFPELKQNNYHQRIWKALTSYLSNPNAEAIHVDVLNAIRVLSRDKSGLDDVMTEELMDTLIDCSGIKAGVYLNEPNHYTVELESAKCLCNLVFNSPVAATMVCKNGTLEGITQRLKTSREMKPPSELLFFDMKILFIVSALCADIRPKLKEDLHGLTYLTDALDHLLQAGRDGGQDGELQDLQVNTACEILKTLFNLTLRTCGGAREAEEDAQLTNLVVILRKLLVARTRSVERKHELVNHVVNLSTNMPDGAYKHLYVPLGDQSRPEKAKRFENFDMAGIFEVLEFLKRTLNKEPGVSHQHELLSPVLSFLLRAASADRAARKYLRLRVLPPLRDARRRPEQGDALRNCICRLLTTPITQVRDLAAELLFVLCKENADRMIKYTGYGNAAGLFARRGLVGGARRPDAAAYSSDSDDSDTEEYRGLKHGINPVLGCYEPPRPDPTADMSEEQKEHEAMKLVRLMDDLTRAGVVRPCRIGPDGKPQPVDHVLELQEGLGRRRLRGDDAESE